MTLVNLVDKDKLDIVKSLRAEIEVGKESLNEEVGRLTRELSVAEDTISMQLSQVRLFLLPLFGVVIDDSADQYAITR